MGETGPVVVFDRVSKRYGDQVVVDDLSFTIERGRIAGLLGRNGAGKTTTMRMLLGLARPDRGEIAVLGTSDVAEVTRRRIGVAMDGLGFCPGASVRQELTIWANAAGASSTQVKVLLDLVGLTEHRAKPCAKLSTGEKQRLRLAVALLSSDVELLVLDEPTNGLDPDGIRWIREFLRDLAGDGLSILVSSHALAEVEHLVDDVLLLDRKLLHTGTLTDLTGGGQTSLEDKFFEIAGRKSSL